MFLTKLTKKSSRLSAYRLLRPGADGLSRLADVSIKRDSPSQHIPVRGELLCENKRNWDCWFSTEDKTRRPGQDRSQ